MNVSSRIGFAAGLAALALSACAPPPPAAPDPAAEPSSGVRVATERALRDAVVGRVFSNDRGTGVLLEDGTMAGRFDGRKLTGTWHWEDRFFCRTIRLDEEDFGPDCQIMLLSGDRIIIVRNRGTGDKETYRLGNRAP